jgi:hypothetical protein
MKLFSIPAVLYTLTEMGILSRGFEMTDNEFEFSVLVLSNSKAQTSLIDIFKKLVKSGLCFFG